MYEKKVYCTNIRVYYGKLGASARINIHESDIEIVENPLFWPEGIICRKWQSKAEWDAELDKRYRERQQRQTYRQNKHQYNPRDNYDYDYNEQPYNYNGHFEYDKNEQAETDNINKWWKSWGKNDRQMNRDEHDGQTYRR